MNAKVAKLLVLAFSLLGLGTARAQESTTQGATTPAFTPPIAPTPSSAQASTPAPQDGMPPQLSNWITYTRPDCCGPIGGNGPITYDLYLRTGPVLPFGSGLLGRTLQAGWDVDGGGRTLFYNVPQDAAWFVDLGVSFMYNHSGNAADTFMFNGEPTHVSVLDRTWFNGGLGYEWYLSGCKTSPGCRWKAGFEGGGRWGMARLDTYGNVTGQYYRLSDTIGAAFVALYTDVEIPCGCCTFEAGFRAEYDYTWMDIIPQKDDVQDVNLLLTAGVRF